MFSTYLVGGLFGLSILCIPGDMTHLRVLTYLLAQGVTVACFVLANGITAEIISTDARSTTFVVVDGISKVSKKSDVQRVVHEVETTRKRDLGPVAL
jgi:TolB-like protein